MPAFNLQLRQVQAFVALVENRSVTAASQALGLAQSTVSEAIAALERELGTALIAHKRGTHTVALTPAGKVLLPHARELLAAVEKTYAAAAEAAVSARGVVNIIANESVSTYVLSQVLMTVRRRWRNTQFAVSVASCPEVREGVRSGAFDLGLLLTSANRKSPARSRSTNGKWSQGEHLIAPLVPLVMFASPAHPLARLDSRSPVRRSALDVFPVFVSDAVGDYRALLERFFRGDDLPGPRLESTGSIEGVKRACSRTRVPWVFCRLMLLPKKSRRGVLLRWTFARCSLPCKSWRCLAADPFIRARKNCLKKWAASTNICTLKRDSNRTPITKMSLHISAFYRK